MEIPVWGTAHSKANISVTLGKVFATARADENGNWQVKFAPMEALWDLKMTITDGEDVIVYMDVCIGEVWLEGGQSNMEYPLAFECNGDVIIEKGQSAEIRFFDYPEVSSISVRGGGCQWKGSDARTLNAGGTSLTPRKCRQARRRWHSPQYI